MAVERSGTGICTEILSGRKVQVMLDASLPRNASPFTNP